MEEGLQGLQQVLLRVRIVVEEAEGRGITNQAMLQQLLDMRCAEATTCSTTADTGVGTIFG